MDGYINVIDDNDPLPSLTIHPKLVEKVFTQENFVEIKFKVTISSKTMLKKKDSIVLILITQIS